jgi:Glycoside-hydrolase family GH114
VSRLRRPGRPLAAVVLLLLLGSGCGDDDVAATTTVALPPAGAGLDYQLGEAYAPDAEVGIVVRDRVQAPAAGRYSICYVNGFQTQPDDASFWLDDHPDLLLRDGDGAPVVDPEWPDEYALDVSTAEQREALLAIVGPWVDRCAEDGFDAAEIDNLDSHTRYEGLDEDDAVAFAAELADRAHAAGLAIAQKNSAELLDRRDETGFDFAVVEQCNEFGECQAFADAYDGSVLVVEYDDAAFARGCERFPELSIVLRDRLLVGPGDTGYVRRSC